MENLTFAKGNFIEICNDPAYDFDMVIHYCNCFNKLDTGIGVEIVEKWPEAAIIDGLTKKADKSKLGLFTFQSVRTDYGKDICLVNAYTQMKPRSKPDVKYLIRILHRIKTNFVPGIKIVMPNIEGIDELESWLKTEFNDLNITVIIYEQD